MLVVSTAVTGFVDARLTHSALSRQTRQLVSTDLRIAQATFTQREKDLVASVRTISDTIVIDALVDPTRRNELALRLSSLAINASLDQLDVLDNAGAALDPAVSVGRLIPLLPLGGTTGMFSTEPTSRLVPTQQGSIVQAVPVTLGSGPRPMVLIGGQEFGDSLAFDLRRQLGGVPDVVLVAGSKVAGSTIDHEQPGAPPAFEPGSGVPPSDIRFVRVGGVRSLVAYAPVGRSAQDPIGGAIGIVVPDPTASLDHDLAVRRAIAGSVLAVLAVALGWLLFRALTQPLVRLAATADEIAGGSLDEPFVPQGSDEIARLAGALEHMREELRAKLDLVADQASQLQLSSQRIVAATDHERRRLARDLHDGIQQQLVVLRMRLGLAQDGASGPGGSGGETGQLADIGAELDRAIASLRDVSHDLYPAILRDRGLDAAVHSYAGRLPLASRIDVVPDPLPRTGAEVESAAYFLLCEAVTNVLKHAKATEVGIRLTVSGDALRVQVEDDGTGFDTAAGARHGGLLHMEDRVRSFGGDLQIASAPGRGTAITATFPVLGDRDREGGDGGGGQAV